MVANLDRILEVRSAEPVSEKSLRNRLAKLVTSVLRFQTSAWHVTLV